MKKSSLLLSSLVAILSSLSTQSVAMAGEGGIASSIAARLDGGVVRDVSISSAIGKTSAFAAARVGGDGSLETYAIGSGGQINFEGLVSGTAFEESPASLGASQSNSISALAIDSTILNPSSLLGNE